MAYMTKVLGVSQEVAEQFAQRNSAAYHEVGMRQAGVPVDTDVTAFWQEVDRLLPGLHSTEELAWLASPGGVSGVFSFLFQIGPHFTQWEGEDMSDLLRALAANAHAYK